MHSNDLESGPALLTQSEAARELGVSLSTVQRLIRRGDLPTVALDTGKAKAATKRVRRSDLAAYVRGLAS